MSSSHFSYANINFQSRKVITATIRIGNTMQGGCGVVPPYNTQVMVVPIKVSVGMFKESLFDEMRDEETCRPSYTLFVTTNLHIK